MSGASTTFKDCVVRIREPLLAQMILDDDIEAIVNEVLHQIYEAVSYADITTWSGIWQAFVWYLVVAWWVLVIKLQTPVKEIKSNLKICT